MSGGETVPNTVKRAPGIPDNLYPASIDVLTAIGPGADCAIATRSSISSSSIHLYFSTNFSRMSGTITYPPPKVKALSVKVAQKSRKKNRIPLFFFNTIPHMRVINCLLILT